MPTDSNEPQSVTVVGLGLMGAALARALLAAGVPTTVWNRTPGRADALVTAGARRAATLDEAVTASPLVLLCLLDHAAVGAVLDAIAAGGDEPLRGRTVVDLTTGTPADARDTARRLAALGSRHLDGKILATPPIVGTPDAMLIYSGPRDAFDRHRPVLQAFGPPTYAGTDPGLAALQDLALLGVMWSAMAGFYHAAALLRAAGITAADVAPTVAEWLTTLAATLPAEAVAIDADSFATDESTLEVNAAGLRHLVEASRELGLRDDVPAAVRNLVDEHVAAGNGKLALASITRVIAGQG